MKIALIAGHQNISGVNTFIITIADAFRRLGNDVVIHNMGDIYSGIHPEIESEFDQYQGSIEGADFCLTSYGPHSEQLCDKYPTVQAVHGTMYRRLYDVPRGVCLSLHFSQFSLRHHDSCFAEQSLLVHQPIRLTNEKYSPGKKVMLIDSRESMRYRLHVERACEIMGFDLDVYSILNGKNHLISNDEFNDCYLVIGKGRSIIQAASVGAPVMCYGAAGGDGVLRELSEWLLSEKRNFSGFELCRMPEYHEVKHSDFLREFFAINHIGANEIKRHIFENNDHLLVAKRILNKVWEIL